MRARWPIVLMVSLLAILLYGCASSQPVPQAGESQDSLDPGSPSASPANQDTVYSPSVKLVATTDFGRTLLLEATVELGGEISALAALNQVARVETQYGGGFVASINGVGSAPGGDSRQKNDWFVYFNGILSNVGALDYTLCPGDVAHWDYRDWSFRQFVPAIVGNFPEPFLHGHGGTVYPTLIVYQDGHVEAAGEIAAALARQGVADVSVKSIAELSASDKETDNIVVVGTAGFSLVDELNRPWDRLGFYCHFEEGYLKVFDGGGELTGEYGVGDGVGVIQATQSIWNPDGVGACENVVWMVSGTDDTGVEAAVDVLVNSSDAFQYACTITIVDGEIVRVP